MWDVLYFFAISCISTRFSVLLEVLLICILHGILCCIFCISHICISVVFSLFLGQNSSKFDFNECNIKSCPQFLISDMLPWSSKRESGMGRCYRIYQRHFPLSANTEKNVPRNVPIWVFVERDVRNMNLFCSCQHSLLP